MPTSASNEMGRKRHDSDDNLGERTTFDPDFDGPLKRRSCTDVICLMLFLAFIGAWIGIGIFAFVRGDPEKLLIPRDSQGSRCGFDAHVADKPYLFFFDLTKCLSPTVPFTGCPTTQVCVEKCPTDAFLNTVDNDLSKTVCKYGVKPTQANIDSGDCAKWVLPSNSVLKRCVPDVGKVDADWWEKFQQIIKYNQQNILQGIQNIEILAQAEQAGYDIVDDLTKAWKELLLGAALSIVVCIIYILMMRWLAPVMVWLSVVGAIAGLSFCVYWSSIKYKYFKDNPYEFERAQNVFEKEFKKSGTWLTLLIIFSVLLGLLVLLVIFLRKRIVLAIALIKEGSKAVSSTTSALFFPIVPWILQFGVLCYTIALAIYVSTVGDPLYEIRDFDSSVCSGKCSGIATGYQNGVECNISVFEQYCNVAGTNCKASCKFIQMSNVNFVPYLHAYNIVGMFWGVFFVSALCEMILAGTFATWYWTFEKKKLPFFAVTSAALRTVRYHLGTLAFGSLIITICRIIRVILEYIDQKLKKYDNEFTKAILCCLKCFFWCLEKFLKFINRNAYIMCAIHGKNFCTSAKDAFNLLMRNIIRVFVLDKITDFVFFLSKIVVVIGVSAIIWSILEYVSVTELKYIYIPVIFVAICTYFVSSVFFKVYTMAIDTLFLCFLEDCERNDGSRERPYYMTKGLMQVLNKKNK